MRKRLSFLLTMVLLLTTIFTAVPKYEVEAAGKYYIQVNKGTNVVTVFKNNGKPYKAMICSTGYDTPVGTFYTPEKYLWHELLGPSWGQYNTRITGGFLFHSVWYYTNGDKSSISVSAYNYLGNTASHGCVRLLVKDAKWIYDNCPLGTKVVIINGTSDDDPLGKPTFMKINPGSYKGWDPTDPDPDNPYRKMKPSMKLTQKNVQFGTKDLDLTSLVTVKNAGGAEVTEGIKTKGKVNTKKLGSYKVKYSYTDDLGNKIKRTYTINVVNMKKPLINGAKNKKSVEKGATLNVLEGVSAASYTGTDLTDKLTVTVKNPNKKKVKVTDGNVKFNKIGTYKVKYKVTDTNGKSKVVTKKFTVIDKRVIITAESPIIIELGTKFKPKSFVTLTSFKGKKLNKKKNLTVVGTVDTSVVGTTKIKYIGTQNGLETRKRTKTVKVKVVNTVAPVFEGGNDITVNEGDNVELLDGITAKTGVGDLSLTDYITVDVNGEAVPYGSYTAGSEGTYTITYTVQIPNGLSATKTFTLTVNKVETEDPGTENPGTENPGTDTPTDN